MPIGTAFHERTLALCESLNYRDWSGYYAVSAYEAHHEHEYNAIRNAAALIDVSPLFKYIDHRARCGAARRSPHHARRVEVAVGQVFYTPWCDEQGKVIDDGTVSRLARAALSLDRRRSEPALVHAERRRARRARSRTCPRASRRWRCRARRRRALLRAVCRRRTSTTLKYFRVTSGTIAGVPVDISRTGYTGDLGYEIWMPWRARACASGMR